ncbi:hypothetical protein H4217_005640 [Coemansia sp. RSA 1939]|nr:hypothetical protein H4217_005640 [Coemansia sp. RSA 1939]KAJ2613187.1 hypothetical protein EV177_002630 [Coemansia sp. RSA 1804]KAJ2692896.1 hypothetical protein GGH99_001447 [Coemansia sp. RSA 1285]
MSQTVAIVGATGYQGGSVLRALHATGKYKLVAVTRDATGTSVDRIKADYPDVKLAEANANSLESLINAFKGADTVFSVTQFFQPGIREMINSGNIDVEYNQGKNIIDAAIAAGVKDIVFSSLPSMNEISGGKYPIVYQFEGKYRAEQYLMSKADKIRGAVIQLGSYMENFVNFARISSEDNKTIEFTFPYTSNALLPLADVANDTGAIVRYIIEHFGNFVGKTTHITSGYYSSQEMVEAFTEATGKPARYAQIPHSHFVGEDLEQMFRGIEEFGMFGGSTEFLETNKELGFKFTSPVEFWKNRGWNGPTSKN